ncbi:alpha/beta fold hydrolase [Priestia aryabhattai]|uniref:alpha/beta fold hydrolase n=1 Tax=Priestia aryabhattai TaxID=412384 RepID=UPI00187579E0|nr:alpha/beta fold hydrolase [Priestia aryabhattai]MBE5102259.1 alpha/beta fold hydrolase [Priestia aryabhattai]
MMKENYLQELKQFVELHIKSQSLNLVKPVEVLERISSPKGKGEGTWAFEWLQAGNEVFEKNVLEAIQCYNFARFPYVNDETQQEAYEKLISSFDSYLSITNIKKERLSFNGGTFNVYTSSLNPKKPLLLVMGGIVSIKEQWFKFLEVGPKLNFSVIVAEFPKVGENSLPFQANSFEIIQNILNYFEDEVDVDHTYYVGMSFGGQLGIQCAVKDSRIKGIVTVGAPLYEFYHLTNKEWNGLPLVTKKTLSHVCELKESELRNSLVDLSIDKNDLNKLDIPITYVFSLKDEIIPAAELEFIKKYIRNLDLVTFEDVHGSPNHMNQVQQLIPEKILKQYKENRSKISMNI